MRSSAGRPRRRGVKSAEAGRNINKAVAGSCTDAAWLSELLMSWSLAMTTEHPEAVTMIPRHMISKAGKTNFMPDAIEATTCQRRVNGLCKGIQYQPVHPALQRSAPSEDQLLEKGTKLRARTS